MTAPSWVSQPFPPEGASAAEGIRNQLGKPELDHLTILVRESAQNSWDARIGDDVPVHYRIDLQTVSAADSSAWRDHLTRRAPMKDVLPLRESLQKPTIRVLSISDRGTRGLGGPTRADTVTDKGRDFVAFLRNIGEPRDQSLGGGTYGFGKGILYLVSKSGTILVHTRCQYEGRYETRLMGAALWKSYDSGEGGGKRRYTGRHWWGDASGEVIEPLVGRAAEMMAARLGLRPFGESETGTTIVIIDPNLEEHTPAEAAEYLADTVTWQLWPKMLSVRGKKPPMRFTVTCDGIDYPVPDPANTKPLRLFVSAYMRMAEGDGDDLRWRSTKLLGRLGIERTMSQRFEPSPAARMAGFDSGMVHHVCLMRPAELVVNYWHGPKPPSEYIAYAGVFRADESMDETFAAAEPPTHDSWNPQSLEAPDSSYVKVTFTRLKEAAERVAGLLGKSDVEAAQVSLGAASDQLSPLVGGAWGIGSATDYGKPGDTKAPDRRLPARRRPSGAMSEGNGEVATASDAPGSETPEGFAPTGSRVGSGTAPKRLRPKIEYVGDAYLDDYWGNAVVVQEFRLPVKLAQRVSADLAVALATDGGLETDPPAGADVPGLVGWEDPTGQLHTTPTFVIEGGTGEIWKAVAKPAADTMTDIVLFTEAVAS
ncbi:hypothetical protein IU485_07210 [Nocardia cyriacigeorgica]|uniref:hypothetical protein n=1 Tax=Nocardia cyriacigeorgica TaxID=135487 RepID=UPI0018953A94|nr:hypothetical protein [Nocardia cyriacigeorgica]MBF6081146.1 hypothetical protein [Nocardia cyriacigeorgica]